MTTAASTFQMINLPKANYKIEDVKAFIPKKGVADLIMLLLEVLFICLEWYQRQEKPIATSYLITAVLFAAQVEIQVRYFTGRGVLPFIIFLMTGEFDE